MSNKKTLAITAFALLLSQQSFARDTEGFYFGSRYYSQFFNSMSKLTAKIGGADAQGSNRVSVDDYAEKIPNKFLDEYQLNYSPIFAQNIALGYSGEFNGSSYRAELEGMYSSIKVDSVDLEGNKVKIMYAKNATKAGQDSQPAQNIIYAYGVKVNNDRIENISVMANAYYYLKNDDFSFSPYVGAGVGATRMKMFGQTSIRPAYQLRAGLDYSINENVNMHIGYRHFGVIGSNFELATDLLDKKVEQTENDKKEYVSQSLIDTDKNQKDSINIGSTLFATHGIEAGLTFHFASKA